MKTNENTPHDPNERMAPGVHHNLGKLGWRTPQSESEVRAAEELAAKSPGELPERLRGMPSPDRSEDRLSDGPGLLGRYLRDDGRSPSTPDESKSKDTDRSDRDLDR